uniref:F-box domain-containing protein n=1 Tax=Pithovirus LCPAC101 TaxID=2506586 RepID=A0A481Z5P8_9VIRU|nr:MAG: hypothetical protein LCPAC101_02530 [Pithovirus LCPAC101]
MTAVPYNYNLKCDYLLDLPEEILLHILTFCNPDGKTNSEFMVYRTISKEFNKRCCDTITQLLVNGQLLRDTSKDVRVEYKVEDFVTCIKNITPEHAQNFRDNILFYSIRQGNIVSMFRKVKYLSLKHLFHIDTDSIIALHHLKSLCLDNIFSSKEISKILKSLSGKLEVLEVTGLSGMFNIPVMKKLTHLKFMISGCTLSFETGILESGVSRYDLCIKDTFPILQNLHVQSKQSGIPGPDHLPETLKFIFIDDGYCRVTSYLKGNAGFKYICK